MPAGRPNVGAHADADCRLARSRSTRTRLRILPDGDLGQISTEGGTEPMWARNGRELFWRRGNAMMAAGIDSSTTTFSPTKSKVLFSGYLTSDPPGLPSYDVAADGRFLMLKGATANSAPTELNVVLNWFEELRNRSKADQ
jgi:hypothetical protein